MAGREPLLIWLSRRRTSHYLEKISRGLEWISFRIRMRVNSTPRLVVIGKISSGVSRRKRDDDTFLGSVYNSLCGILIGKIKSWVSVIRNQVVLDLQYFFGGILRCALVFFGGCLKIDLYIIRGIIIIKGRSWAYLLLPDHKQEVWYFAIWVKKELQLSIISGVLVKRMKKLSFLSFFPSIIAVSLTPRQSILSFVPYIRVFPQSPMWLNQVHQASLSSCCILNSSNSFSFKYPPKP